MFKVIIAGGRDFDNYELLRDSCRKLLTNKHPNVIVVSGCAKGTDKLGEVFAAHHFYDIEPFPADWDDLDVVPCVIKHNKTGKPYNALAGHNRNELMANYADALIAFWDGKSKGTKHMIDFATKKGLLIKTVRY